MIRILLVDDHVLVREALRVVLEMDSGMQVIAEADDGESALRIAAEITPDVAVMDVALPGISGIETTRRLLAQHPGIKVLALSTHVDRGIIQQMIGAGAHGYIIKAAAGVELKKGILSVMAGKFYLCPEISALLVENTLQALPGARTSDNQSLTFRERQVVTLLAGGKHAPEIAGLLHISVKTVDVHRRNILRKLNLHNIVDLTKYALRAGLIQL